MKNRDGRTDLKAELILPGLECSDSNTVNTNSVGAAVSLTFLGMAEIEMFQIEH